MQNTVKERGGKKKRGNRQKQRCARANACCTDQTALPQGIKRTDTQLLVWRKKKEKNEKGEKQQSVSFGDGI